ncbi:MAG TPA: exonuclease SbcCD subunit D [Propioniciclava sp.]|uniref:exonuclease SbcCD subunit D n=1 Tax=Propioniciclava sp. TaxID=2038686 RepID=UPI002CF5315E|nr:exonuclease SbcCD subunit D [Propioniciclava sp.]HRL48625.1 exonuclease SbcCD subunit D [Propioniciclava sp.]HRL80537.1 exonuclease SbcCD subunit D [Propioniciclava sp.]
MKFLHTADWHVGKTLKGRSRLEEQRAVLREIVDIALRENVDAVLIAGDLYDSAAPSAEAQRLVNGALLALAQAGIEVIVIAGNHDHARTFEALRQLMAVAGIDYSGMVRTAEEGGVHRFTARATGEEAVVALVPFVSRRRILGTEEIVTGTPSENAGHYERSVREILATLARSFTPDTVNIVMAHLTCTGGVMGGGEREAQSIFEYHVSAQAFPITAHYVALGHLHRRQQIPAPVPVVYSGAPVAVDFGEQENTPVVCLVEASPRTPATITDIPLTTGKRLRTVTGTVAELIAARADFGDDYLRVVVQEPVRAGLRDEVLEALPQALEIRIHPDFAQTRTHRGVQHTTRSPRDLFAAYCDEAGLQDPRLTALFSELLDETTGVS